MANALSLRVWVIDDAVGPATLERLGDARLVADRMDCGVGVLIVGAAAVDGSRLIAHGADRVIHAVTEGGVQTRVTAAWQVLKEYRPRLALACGDAPGREWAARLAARGNWRLVSPGLLLQARGGNLEITALDRAGKLCRRVQVPPSEAAVVTLRPGVGEALPADPARQGESSQIQMVAEAEAVVVERMIPADPRTVDIRFAPRLVAGGRGLGGRTGFETLGRFAEKLGAGVAASRMAVDLGWIERERQVGQTGKTVAPELYIACGISGASHHLEGMSEAKHIVAINTDAAAPVFQKAHLGLVADLYEVLEKTTQAMGGALER